MWERRRLSSRRSACLGSRARTRSPAGSPFRPIRRRRTPVPPRLLRLRRFPIRGPTPSRTQSRNRVRSRRRRHRHRPRRLLLRPRHPRPPCRPRGRLPRPRRRRRVGRSRRRQRRRQLGRASVRSSSARGGIEETVLPYAGRSASRRAVRRSFRPIRRWISRRLPCPSCRPPSPLH
jgi:hypothetical protein